MIKNDKSGLSIKLILNLETGGQREVHAARHPVLTVAHETPGVANRRRHSLGTSALEATQGQMGGFFSQLPYKYHLEEVACGRLT